MGVLDVDFVILGVILLTTVSGITACVVSHAAVHDELVCVVDEKVGVKCVILLALILGIGVVEAIAEVVSTWAAYVDVLCIAEVEVAGEDFVVMMMLGVILGTGVSGMVACVVSRGAAAEVICLEFAVILEIVIGTSIVETVICVVSPLDVFVDVDGIVCVAAGAEFPRTPALTLGTAVVDSGRAA